MKLSHILCASLLVAATSGLALAQQAPADNAGGNAGGGQRGNRGGGQGAGQGPGGFLRNMFNNSTQYEDMTKAIPSLTDDQKTKLKAACDAMTKELNDFTDSSRAKFDPQAGRDAMREQFQKLGDDRAKLVGENQTKINAVLTPEQRAEWETYKLGKQVTNRLADRPMGGTAMALTDDQKTQIDALTKTAGKNISELKDPKDPKAISDITGDLWQQIVAKILTKEQVGKLFAPPLGGMGGPGGMGGMGGPGGAMGAGGGNRGGAGNNAAGGAAGDGGNRGGGNRGGGNRGGGNRGGGGGGGAAPAGNLP